MSYNSSAIEVLTGLDPIKTRPGMYTDTRSPLHLVQEILDNSIDEARNKSTSKVIDVVVEDGRTVTVKDRGRGIPIDDKGGKSALRVVVETMHSGAKFYQGGGSAVKTASYTTSAGLHGVGLCVVAALSSTLEITVCRDNTKVVVQYADGVFLGETRSLYCGETGTTVKFTPNPKYFSSVLNMDDLLMLLRRRSAVTGVSINYTRDNSPQVVIREDLLAFVYSTIWGGKVQNTIPFAFNYSYDGGEAIHVEGAVVVPTSGIVPRGINSVAYYNGMLTAGGGDHILAVAAALKDALMPYYSPNTKLLMQPDDDDFPIMVSISVPGEYQVQLASQTKDSVVSNAVYELWKPLSKILESHFNTHKRDAVNFIQAVDARVSKREQLRQQEAAKNAPAALPMPDPDVFKKPKKFDPTRTEIMIIEGQSAQSGGNNGLDRTYQGTLQIRGMADNAYTEGAHISDRLAWLIQESHRICRIIIMTDADQAGYGIALSIIGTFWKHAPHIIRGGKLFIVRPPLYRVVSPEGNVSYYNDYLPENVVGDVCRFKGLGSMNPEDQSVCCYNPTTRKLIPLTITDDDVGRMDALMHLIHDNGKAAAEARREWLGG